MLETGINGVLSMDTQATPALERLEGRTLEVHLDGLEITLYFSVARERFKVSTSHASDKGEVDTKVKGSPGALFAMAVPEWGKASSGVHIEGDAMLARDLEKLFKKLDPDWEEPLTRVFGDLLGHQMAVAIRQGSRWAKQAAQSSGEMLKDYLQEEAQVAVHPMAMEAFLNDVDELREAADRVEARIHHIENLEWESSGDDEAGNKEKGSEEEASE